MEPTPRPESTRLIVHLVHGTWPEGVAVSLRRWARPGLKYTPEDGDRFWFQAGHPFRKQLTTELAAAGFEAELRAFVWSGANSFAARDQAARELVPHLARGMHEGGRQLIVAHSHGGTVAMLAMQLIEQGETPFSFGEAPHLGWLPPRRDTGKAITIDVEDVVEISADRVRAGVRDIELVTLATPFLRVEPFGSSAALWSTFAMCWMTAFAALAIAVARRHGQDAGYFAMAGMGILLGIGGRLVRSARGYVQKRVIASQACRFIGRRIQCVRGVADEAELTISAGIVGCNIVRTLLVFAGQYLSKVPVVIAAAAYLAAVALLTWALLAQPGSRIVHWTNVAGIAAMAIILLLGLSSSMQGLLGVELAVSGFGWLTTVESSPDAERHRIEVVTLASTQDTAQALRHAVYAHPDCAAHIVAGLRS